MLWRSAEISFPREPLRVQCVQISHVQIFPDMEESLEIFRKASVCTLKCNVFGREVLFLSTGIS